VLLPMSGGGLRAQQPATSYTLDPAHSAIYVVTHRTGLFSFLGHEHAILATQWSGHVCWSRAEPTLDQAEVTVMTQSLAIDSDSARAVAHLGKGPSPAQVRDIQKKFLDGNHLDAANHPLITLTIPRVTGVSDRQIGVSGELSIHGRSRVVEFPVAYTAAHDTLRFRGTVSVPQSAFGIKPESIAGVVKVADVVDIYFDLLGVATTGACSATK